MQRTVGTVARAIPLGSLAALGILPLAYVAGRGLLARPDVDATALLHSIGFALGGAFIATLFGGAAGLLVGTLEFPGRRLATALLALPMAAPPAFWWLGFVRAPLLAGKGLSGGLLETFAAGIPLAPVPFLLALAATREMSPSTYDAARLALPPMRRAGLVLVPLCRGALLAGFLLCTALLLGESEIPFLFGSRTLATEIVTRFSQTFDARLVAPVATPLLVFTLVLALAARRPLLRSLLSPRSGDGVRRIRSSLALAPALLLALPVLWALVGYAAATIPVLGSRRELPFSRATVAASVVEPLFCAIVALFVGVAGAALARLSRALPVLLGIGLVVFCMPASVLAVGWIGLGAPFGIEVPPALIHVSRLWPLSALAFAAAAARLPTSLLHSAALVPISAAARMRRLVLPVLAPSLAAASALTATLVFADRDVASLLLSPGSERVLLDVYLLSANAPAAAVGRAALAALGCGLAAGAFAALAPWATLRPRG